jgi:hypothetical protein
LKCKELSLKQWKNTNKMGQLVFKKRQNNVENIATSRAAAGFKPEMLQANAYTWRVVFGGRYSVQLCLLHHFSHCCAGPGHRVCTRSKEQLTSFEAAGLAVLGRNANPKTAVVAALDEVAARIQRCSSLNFQAVVVAFFGGSVNRKNAVVVALFDVAVQPKHFEANAPDASVRERFSKKQCACIVCSIAHAHKIYCQSMMRSARRRIYSNKDLVAT